MAIKNPKNIVTVMAMVMAMDINKIMVIKRLKKVGTVIAMVMVIKRLKKIAMVMDMETKMLMVT